MAILLRPLRDAPEHAAIVAAWTHHEWAHLTGRSEAQTLDRFASELRTDHAELPFTIVAVSGADAVGFASLRVREGIDWDPGKSPWIGNVYVARPHRGRGVAGRMVDVLSQEAGERGFPAVHLACADHLLAYYQRLDFKPYRRADPPHDHQTLLVRDLISAADPAGSGTTLRKS